MRGRVMSFYAMAFQAVAPFGSLIAGAFAVHIGAPRTLMIGRSVCILGAGLFLWQLPGLRRIVRPIYVRWESSLKSRAGSTLRPCCRNRPRRIRSDVVRALGRLSPENRCIAANQRLLYVLVVMEIDSGWQPVPYLWHL